ncbi:MAG TPA: BMP family protein [Candidatus Acidoferrales bacterium]|nr:BMP family protein [Candidatus Acidoferrales bacterium]
MRTISRRAFQQGLVSVFAWSVLPVARASEKRLTRVALLLPGVITDGGWAELAYNGLKELQAQGSFKTAYEENITLAQMDQVARGYSDDGFDLIIGHGVEFSSTLLEVAPDYPNQHYFVTTFLPQPTVPPNIMYIHLGYWGAAYGAGVLAALISDKKQAVGFIGGNDDPNQQRIKRAFVAGAQRTVAGIRALAIITGDYDNAAKGREAASILIGNGADVIWHAADVTGLGAIQGAVAGNAKVMGCYSDQTALAPNHMATSFEMNLEGMVTTIARAVAAQTFAGGTEWRPPVNQMWLLKCGINGDHNPRLVSADQWATFKKVWADIASGQIDVDRMIP